MKRDRLAWPILLLLLTVLIPSVGVVWMMREAVRNERVATRQRLQDAYAAQLETARQTIQSKWQANIASLSGRTGTTQPAKLFATLVESDGVDSALICDLKGAVVYPNTQPHTVDATADAPGNDHRWQRARSLEFQQEEPLAAARVYSQLATELDSVAQVAVARMSEARCLSKAGQQEAALEQLSRVAADEFLRDAQGRSPSATARFRMLELLDENSERWNEEAEKLASQLDDYDEPAMPASQRLFLMNRLAELSPGPIDLPTRHAEKIAASCVDSFNRTQRTPEDRVTRLTQTAMPEIWSYASEDGKLVVLFETDTLVQQLTQQCRALPTPAGVTLEVIAPDQEIATFLSACSLGDSLDGWQLGLKSTQGDPFIESSRQRAAVQIWIAVLTVAATCVLGWMVWSSLQRRLRLAQLKNDLVATVSHELKTPLASIRLLVDTLLGNDDGSEASPARSREYLQLISKENSRLTRMIDNFLTFSRLDQGSQTLQRREIRLTDLINQASTVFLSHVPEAEPVLHCDATSDVRFTCDVDSLVTAIVNLLENAWKYSAEEKRIELRADGDLQSVSISVSDNGIGLDPADRKRVFDRFYQVDQRVARDSSGCGLGLSIVQSIVCSHGGTVKVESEPEHGSMFTIKLPRVTDAGTLD